MSRNNSFTKVALPYAEALFNLSQSMQLVEDTGRHLNLVLDTVKNSTSLKNFLSNPLFVSEMKKKVLSELFIDQIHNHVLNFLYILVERRRIAMLHSIIQCYLDLVNKLQFVLLAEVNTVIPLNELQKRALQDKLKCMTNSKEIRLIEKVDPELIGGLVVKIGSKVIDMSIYGQLNQMSFYLNSVYF